VCRALEFRLTSEVSGRDQTRIHSVSNATHPADSCVRRGSLRGGKADFRWTQPVTLFALAQAAADQIGASLNPRQIASPSTDAQIAAALASIFYHLSAVADNRQGLGGEAARRPSRLLLQLAKPDAGLRQRVEAVIAVPLPLSLDQMRHELSPQRVSVGSSYSETKLSNPSWPPLNLATQHAGRTARNRSTPLPSHPSCNERRLP